MFGPTVAIRMISIVHVFILFVHCHVFLVLFAWFMVRLPNLWESSIGRVEVRLS